MNDVFGLKPSDIDPVLSEQLDRKLSLRFSADPACARRIHSFYLPVFFWVRKAIRSSSQPLMIGLNGPQGAGKTTLTGLLCELLDDVGLRSVSVSIDDFYLTRAQQIEVARANPENIFLQSRGYPGTHDLELGAKILGELESSAPRTVYVPRFDKSLNSGQGDRIAKELWQKITVPVRAVFLEGWMLGFTPVAELQIHDSSFREINRLLADYSVWHELLDAFIWLHPLESRFVVDWRIEAEEKMKARGLTGMSTAEITSYIEKFLPAYDTYLPQLARKPPLVKCAQNYLRIPIAIDRLPHATD